MRGTQGAATGAHRWRAGTVDRPPWWSVGQLPRWARIFGLAFLALSLVSDLSIKLPPLFDLEPGSDIWSAAVLDVLVIVLCSLGLAWLTIHAAVAAVVVLVSATLALALGVDVALPLFCLILVAGFLGGLATRRLTVGYLTLAGVWTLVYALARPGESAVLFAAVPAMAVAFGLGDAIRAFRHQRSRDRRRIELLDRQRREAVRTERRSIARELHDIVAHDITVISMMARAAELTEDPASMRAALGTIGDNSRSALNDLRRMLQVLRAQEADAGQGRPDDAAHSEELADRVGAVVDRLRAVGVHVESVVDDAALAVPRSAGYALARIVQEASTNVIKHAGPGAWCRISLIRSATAVTVTVTSTPAEPHRMPADVPRSGYGLAGMRERAQIFGGEFSAGPVDRSWVVTCTVPIVP